MVMGMDIHTLLLPTTLTVKPVSITTICGETMVIIMARDQLKLITDMAMVMDLLASRQSVALTTTIVSVYTTAEVKTDIVHEL